jgi:tetratricopeptide (TPR) repeat protein
MSGEGSREVRYTAFLSYSHKDAAAAGRLHRRLENYRMPRRLVGGEGARGPIPDHLSPIFRDREELPAATDLSETVRAALAQSGALIILCSPAAAASLWVAEEIETFRRLHPDRPILAAVLDGDPPECFPAALRAFGRDGTWHEPLATDLRPHRDGARLGLLKLVAGITGVGLDALVQRDAARRVRRVMAVTMGAVAMMLVMAALALVAVGARREAEHQRAEAEGLAGFMLTDLHDRLEGVGRLDIMRAVNQRALAHYDAQIARGDHSSQTILQRARVLRGLGEEDILAGDMRAALSRFVESRRITMGELADAPNDRARRYAHSQSEYGLGRVYELQLRWPLAQRHYASSAALAEHLAAQAPDQLDYVMAAGGGAIGVGDVQYSDKRNYVAAQQLYERAVRHFERAARLAPSNRTVLLAQANAYAWLADSYYGRHLWQQSLDERLRQYAIVARLHRADSSNAENTFRLAAAQIALARSLSHVGQTDRARALMIEAYRGSDRLTQLDPGNAEWLLFKGFVECTLFQGALGPPPGVTRAGLGRDIRAIYASLRHQNNPRAADLTRCVVALPGQ